MTGYPVRLPCSADDGGDGFTDAGRAVLRVALRLAVPHCQSLMRSAEGGEQRGLHTGLAGVRDLLDQLGGQ